MHQQDLQFAWHVSRRVSCPSTPHPHDVLEKKIRPSPRAQQQACERACYYSDEHAGKTRPRVELMAKNLLEITLERDMAGSQKSKKGVKPSQQTRSKHYLSSRQSL